MMASNRYLAIFDMDGVLTTTRSSWRIIHEALGTDNRINYDLYLSGKISYREFMIRDITEWLTAKPDLNADDITAILSGIEIRRGTIEALNLLREYGFVVAVVSGGLYMLAEIINRSFKFDKILANRLLFDVKGKLVRDGQIMVNPTAKGINVNDLIERYSIGKENTVSIGDTPNDESMFRVTRRSILVNPEDNYMNPFGTTILAEDLLVVAEQILKDFRIK